MHLLLPQEILQQLYQLFNFLKQSDLTATGLTICIETEHQLYC